MNSLVFLNTCEFHSKFFYNFEILVFEFYSYVMSVITPEFVENNMDSCYEKISKINDLMQLKKKKKSERKKISKRNA